MAASTVKAKRDGNSSSTTQSVDSLRRYCKTNNIEVVDFKFNDLPGMWQHFSIPAAHLLETNGTGGIWTDGIGFDGSSIRGFQKIQESDMILMPDRSTAVMDPICQIPTLSVICDIYDPITKKPYSRDPRYIAKKAEKYLIKTKIAEESYWGPEAEFFVFDDVRFAQSQKQGFYHIDSAEASWNTGKDEKPNLGYKPRYKEGYFPCAPHDTLQDFRSEIMLVLRRVGVEVECHHHEVATGGQCEIDIKYGPLVNMADNLMWYKYVIKNIAKRYNKTATFMPKPVFQDNGSGMHCHQSLWKSGKPLFFDSKGYALTSQMCRWYIGGLLKHAKSILAFAAPTTNSYKRLVPGYEAPVNLVMSARNRSAAVRIPVYNEHPKGKRVEFRSPDPSCNAYLAFSAMLMAGLDGIQNKIDPGAPCDKNLYELPEKEASKIRTVPKSLEEAINALEKDHQYLLKGDVFTQDVIDTWIDYKRAEMDEIRLRPHPWEFHLYYDI
jgi:glutamine synthetase